MFACQERRPWEASTSSSSQGSLSHSAGHQWIYRRIQPDVSKVSGSHFFSNRIWPCRSRFAGFESSAFSGALPSVWLSPKPDPQLFLLSAVGDEVLSRCFHWPLSLSSPWMASIQSCSIPRFPCAHFSRWNENVSYCQCFTSHHGVPVHLLWIVARLEHAQGCTLSTTRSRPCCQPAGQWPGFQTPF